MRSEFGLTDACVDVHFAGRTDRALAKEILERNGLDAGVDSQQRLLSRYTQLLPAVLAADGGRVLPGIVELLHRLSSIDGVVCYVMTGNLAVTAAHKLEHFGLKQFFRGIFGGDHDHDRDDLARRTAATLKRRHGPGAAYDFVVIGDTPADIRCGRAMGARVVAVCTGSHDRDSLAALRPEAVHDDLSDIDVVLRDIVVDRPQAGTRDD